jgi:hypothetical protein
LAPLFLRAALPLRAVDLARRVWRSVVVSLVVVVALIPVDRLPNEPTFTRVLVIAATATTAWIGALFLVRHPAIGLLTSIFLRAKALGGPLLAPRGRQ